VVSSKDRRRGRLGARGQVDAAMLWASGSCGSTRGGAAEVHEGQGGPGIAGGEQLLGKLFTYDGGSRGNFGAVVAETEGSGLGVDPGPDAEPLRGSGRARRWRCSVAVAAQTSARRSKERRRARVWWWWLRMGGVRRGSRGAFKGGCRGSRRAGHWARG
jgi:hypothetical protein